MTLDELAEYLERQPGEDRLDHVHRLLQDGYPPGVIEIWTGMPAASVRHVMASNGYIETTHRQEFSRGVRDGALERAGGRCEECGRSHTLEVHHKVPCWLGGGGTIDNAQVLCRWCHRRVSAADRARQEKSKRLERQLNGQPKRKRRPSPKIQSRGFRKDLSRGFDGSVRKKET